MLKRNLADRYPSCPDDSLARPSEFRRDKILNCSVNSITIGMSAQPRNDKFMIVGWCEFSFCSVTLYTLFDQNDVSVVDA